MHAPDKKLKFKMARAEILFFLETSLWNIESLLKIENKMEEHLSELLKNK